MNEALIVLIREAVCTRADAALALGRGRVSELEIGRLYDEAADAYVNVLKFIQDVDITAKTS